jgi:hypothetical protein
MDKDVVFNFSKPSVESTVASNRIARFLSDTLEIPLVYDSSVASTTPRILFIVNGAFAFCKVLPELSEAVRAARRIVWVQNDYTIVPPKLGSNAQSPFRKSFAELKRQYDMWTTVAPMAALTSGSRYMNWNSLSYEPLAENTRRRLRSSASDTLFYYGAFRKERKAAFDRYFLSPAVETVVSSTSDKFSAYPVKQVSGIPRNAFFETLTGHGLGLYLEDKRSSVEFHSPASRFYEMLSAGLPMVFQREAVAMMKEAGYDIRPYVVEPSGLRAALKDREKIGRRQRQEWSGNYVQTLRSRVKKSYHALLRKI